MEKYGKPVVASSNARVPSSKNQEIIGRQATIPITLINKPLTVVSTSDKRRVLRIRS